MNENTAATPPERRPGAVPIVDLSPLRNGTGPEGVARAIDRACRTWGFFYVRGHGVSEALVAELERLSHDFFALAEEEKLQIRMGLAGRAWRGYFPIGAELTSGLPDQKEGLYFGNEISSEDPRVQAGRPLHGPNLFPKRPSEMAATVLEYIEQMTDLGQTIMAGVALALGLSADHFRSGLTREPLALFRVFHYPPIAKDRQADLWSVGEHTDYGLLTILHQDAVGGLQVKIDGVFTAAPPIPGTFVCNIGDMLDRLTSGQYRSTAHRVRNVSDRSRLSLPFFFDPGWDSRVEALPGFEIAEAATPRWDGKTLHAAQGTYGEYLLGKVAKVFPGLSQELG